MHFSSAVLFALVSNACLVSADSNQSYASSCRNRVVTVNGRSCNQQCGVDYPGGDYKSFRTSGYQGCVNACAMDSKCTHASYQCEYGICYLKVNKSYGQSGRQCGFGRLQRQVEGETTAQALHYLLCDK
ncbi:unnamed protein product [Zymoseptoria tritici ST99CH_1A5]|uniref:Apple domain-containing protein n=1 Tax=Zymoseptoria tritici ST99CH_1A5 TaxID=1276529 RepID=A0A1Y6LFZ2_ZYMTR|nr:unnamed protein product [Zymoseptoria tritici ST99CH_1A5]